MTAKMRQRRRHDRAKRVLVQRRENAVFFARGTIPASASSFAMCSCGAAAFSRDAHDGLDDFDDAHAYCDEVTHRCPVLSNGWTGPWMPVEGGAE